MYRLLCDVMKAYLSGKRETCNCPGGMFFGGEAFFENCATFFAHELVEQLLEGSSFVRRLYV